MGRGLFRAEDGSSMDIIRFDTAETATAAFEEFPGHPEAEAFEAMLDPSAISMPRWSIAKSW